jgi:hypothetical protein
MESGISAKRHPVTNNARRSMKVLSDKGVDLSPAKDLSFTIQKQDSFAKKNGVPAEVASSVPAAYNYFDPNNLDIAANSDSGYWSNPALWMIQAKSSGLMSTAHENHVMVHEIGHHLHRAHAGKVFDNLTFDKHPQTGQSVDPMTFHADTMERFGATDVTRYAQSHPLEFVAETFARMALTKEPISQGTVDLYNFYGGPPVPGRSERGSA